MRRKLLFLGCNLKQVPYLKILKEQDWFIVGIDLNPKAPGKSLCDNFCSTGYDNLSGLIEIGEKEQFSKKDKIFTAASQFAHKGAAHFANYFKIDYPAEKSIDICLNKYSFYKLFQKNNIPIPVTWYIKNEEQLRSLISSFPNHTNYYLKSDHSKNPNYIYSFSSDCIPYSDINWTHDKYFREYYVLQEEFTGIHLRINVYDNRYNVFDFHTNILTHNHKRQLEYNGTIKALRVISKLLGFQNWLVKFDVILNGEKYVVLDIGIDPPFRMRVESKKQNINFERLYLNHYLQGHIEYPNTLD
tara:strand:+ start:1007 stop:1909 length:903 start_codon:yes stop_codon:yes gene_type:complete